MPKILKGAEVATALSQQVTAKVTALSERGITPTLAIVRVGEREDDLAYERGAVKKCATLGIVVEQHALSKEVDSAAVYALIEQLNADENVHGVLIMRPLPPHIDDKRICNLLSPKKDVDGITEGSMAGIYSGTPSVFAPCTARACMELLAHYGIDPASKHVAVIGRSLVIGKPVAMLLLAKNATVTLCHTKTKNIEEVCRQADMLIAAAGKAKLIGAKHVAANQIVLDVGIHALDEGGLCGDVAYDEVLDTVGAITPVPGGVGSVTTSVLALHVATAAWNTNL